MSDISVVLDKESANKVLAEVPFPMLKVFHPQNLLSGDGTLGEAETVVGFADRGEHLEIEDLSTLLEDIVIDTVRETDREDIGSDDLDDIFLGKLMDSLESLSVGRDDLREQIVRAFAQEKHGADLRDELNAALARGVKVEVKWVKLWIYNQPDAIVSNPIELRDLKLGVQAKVRACVKLFGRWRCISITTPTVKIEGESLRLSLFTNPPVVWGRPSFKNLDIVIRIRIFGVTFKIKIGITGIVNKQLKKAGPIKIVDLGSFEQKIPETAKTAKIDSLAINAHATGLLVEADLKVV